MAFILLLSHKNPPPHGRASAPATARAGLQGYLRYPWLGSLFAMMVAFLPPSEVFAVRPFVTDDARVVYPGQLEVENFGGITLGRGRTPGFEVRSLQGSSVTDRLEIIGGGFGFQYENNKMTPQDLVFQPKYVLYRSFGLVPSVSAAAAVLAPLSGNKQLWNSYNMLHVSWFLFTPQDSTDPYDNGLAIHVNLGTKGQYNAGLGGRWTNKLYWAAGFEVITPISRELRVLGEVFNGDPFSFEEEFPAYQVGFRWYKTPNLQWDLVLRGVRDGGIGSGVGAGIETGPGWNYTLQIGLRFLMDDVFPFR
ncbi:hypothetical protein [Nitrospira moscoviensis]|uniref:Uncharacterized protein n=1 Tax=Nitrospira moscoviensis TaxID=42253 RepID=A0A0K2GEN2_NITMO|nr:hypothetical protein [Nitrospira moscoviensis]ALA59403.1 hypothetical protein NITMOv2_2998 [Nitrospira moscoviensis]